MGTVSLTVSRPLDRFATGYGPPLPLLSVSGEGCPDNESGASMQWELLAP